MIGDLSMVTRGGHEISNTLKGAIDSQGRELKKKKKKTYRLRRCQYSIQNFFLAICMNKLFALIILLLITINTIILALDMYPIDTKRELAFD